MSDPNAHPHNLRTALKINNLGHTPLHIAAQNDDTEDTIELLLNNNADINTTNNLGDTPLHLAAYLGHTEIIDLLIAHNAQLNTRNNNGQTPLDIARESLEDNHPTIQLLEFYTTIEPFSQKAYYRFATLILGQFY